jgi:hypothetical protein
MIKSDFPGRRDSDEEIENSADDGMQNIYLNDESNLLLPNLSEKDNMFNKNLNRYLKEKEKKIIGLNENNFSSETKNNSKQQENESKNLSNLKNKKAFSDNSKKILNNDNGDDEDDDELLLLHTNTGKITYK